MYNKAEIISWLISCGVLKIGDFTLKSGRKSRYFFNLGEVYNGIDINAMGDYYYHNTIKATGLIKKASVVFGPAYKGIPLSVAVAMRSAEDPSYCTLNYCFNRKEEKDHGDGGKLVGSPLQDKKVILIDDVVTSGQSIIEAAKIVKLRNADVEGVVVFIDRMEPGAATVDSTGGKIVTAKDYIEDTLGVPVYPVITAEDIATDPAVVEKFPAECEEILKTVRNE